MINQPLRLPFVWYDDIKKQSAKRVVCKGAPCYKLVTPKNRLLPFQFRSELFNNSDTVTSWLIMHQDGAVYADITNQKTRFEIYATVEGVGYLQYRGLPLFTNSANTVPIDLSCGFYYSAIVINGATFYSEIFFVPDVFTEDNYMKIEWNDLSDIGNIIYSQAYHNILYLESEIEKSGHDIYEEGIEDGEKNFIPSFQKYINTLRFDEFAPDYLVSALVCMQLHNIVKITPKQKYGFEQADALNIKTSVTWDDNGCFAVVEVKFLQEESVFRTGCTTNILLL